MLCCAAYRRWESLYAPQKVIVAEVFLSDRNMVLLAPPGAGKTRLLGTLVHLFEKNDDGVLVLTPTLRAAEATGLPEAQLLPRGLNLCDVSGETAADIANTVRRAAMRRAALRMCVVSCPPDAGVCVVGLARFSCCPTPQTRSACVASASSFSTRRRSSPSRTATWCCTLRARWAFASSSSATLARCARWRASEGARCGVRRRSGWNPDVRACVRPAQNNALPGLLRSDNGGVASSRTPSVFESSLFKEANFVAYEMPAARASPRIRRSAT
jgi:hypothetical protein